MEGKAILFKEFAGVEAFPICLDTNNVDDIVRTVKNIAPVFGGINLEDISAPRCFEIEKRLKEELDIPVFHDDQHGTAIVVSAAIVNAVKLMEKFIVGTGRSDFPNQVNNVLAFPGIFRGALDVRATDINEEMKVAATYAIANSVPEEELNTENILPMAFDKNVAENVAEAVKKAAIESGVVKK